MNILYDARMTLIDRQDGISRYGANLLKALAKQHAVTMLIYDKRQLSFLPDIPYVIISSPYSAQDLLLPLAINKLKPDVVYSPFFTIGLGNFRRRYKVIVTTHDLIYYHDPTPSTYLSKRIGFVGKLFACAIWPQRFLLNRADRVVTVSNTTKQLLEQRHLTKRPITVIYNAPSKLPTVMPTGEIKKELVYMGVLKPYKNVELLIKGLRLLPGYTLHCLSKVAPERRAELERLADDPKRVIFWDGVSDEQYAQLLGTATALVTASKDEGFGLPLIEAMAARMPVLCSDIPIFHEVAGKAAIFFDPDSPESFAKAVHAVEDSNIRTKLIKAGSKQAATFTWEESAKRLLALMHEVTGT